MPEKLFIKTHNLTKDYGNHKGAFNINIELSGGEIVGFIGPNGAGKTTTIKMLLGFTDVDSGTVSLFGDEIHSEADRLKHIAKIGFLPGEPVIYKNFNIRQILNYLGELSDGFDKANLDRLLSEFDLAPDLKYKNLSLGNKRKVGVIASLLNNPMLLILDEPTSSLDPLMQVKVLDEVERIKKNGGAVFFSSHVLSEVEKVADRIFLIKDGEIIFQGRKNQIAGYEARRVKIEKADSAVIKKFLGKDDVLEQEKLATVVYTTNHVPLLQKLLANKITDFYVEQPTLEDIFLKFYEKK